MRSTLSKKLFGLGVALFGMVFGATSAFAAAQLVLFDGTTTVIVTDNGIGDDDATVGIVDYNGAFGDWNIKMTAVGATKPVLGSAAMGEMHFNTFEINSGGAAELWAFFSDTGFATSNGSPIWLDGGFGGASDGTVQMDICLNTDNTQSTSVATCNSVATSGAIAGPFPSWTGSGSGTGTSDVFGMAIALHITHTGTGSTSVDSTLHVPEPGILGLFGFGLLGMGVAARRRRKV